MEVYFAGRNRIENWRDQLSILQFVTLRTTGNQYCLLSTEVVLLLLHHSSVHLFIPWYNSP